MLYVEFIFLFILINVFLKLIIHSNDNRMYVRSTLDGKKYMVRNEPDGSSLNASNMLAKINLNFIKLITYLEKNKKDYDGYTEYIDRLIINKNNFILSENTKGSESTSYSINKGEELVFCIRSKSTHKIHNENTIMYVAIHELAHIACPIYDNHGELFQKIFKFLLEVSIKIGIYDYVNYKNNPTEYCGMTINSV